jgi:hypothetical protein
MTGDQIRELLRATPFSPFRIHVAEQTYFDIPQSDFAWLSQSGNVLVVNAASGDVVHLIDVPFITRVEKQASPTEH